MKKVIAAAIEKILEFDSPEEAGAYLDDMKASGKEFRIILDCGAGGGKRRVRIREQYNKSPMIEGQ